MSGEVFLLMSEKTKEDSLFLRHFYGKLIQ